MRTDTKKVDVLAILDDEIESLPKMAEWACADASVAIERLISARKSIAYLLARADDAAQLLESLAPMHPRTKKLRVSIDNATAATT